MKKLLKRTLSVILSAALVLCAGPLSGFVGIELPDFGEIFNLKSNAESFSEDIFTYTVTNGCATVTGCQNPVANIVVPDTLGGYPVTAIGSGAFEHIDGLTSVVIPGSVKTIGWMAFECCISLESVALGNGVTTIEDRAFASCYSIESIVIPDSVDTIGAGAFSDCYAMSELTIGSNVTTIGEHAFDSCESLEYLYIPSSVTSIGDGAFSYCAKLTGITIPDGITSIGEYMFFMCSSLTDITIPDSVTSIGGYAFYECNSLAGITIPDSVISMGTSVFGECSSLVRVTLSDSITIIDDYLFENCANLVEIEISNGITSIGDYAFNGCRSLTNVMLPDSVISIGVRAFSDCKSITTVTMGKNVTKIGEYAFYECADLESVKLSDNLLTIGQGAFMWCYDLGNMTIPDTVIEIGESAFRDCNYIESVKIPDSTTFIGDYAFYSCSALISVTLGKNVTSINDFTFAECISLKNIDIPSNIASIGEYAFENCVSLEYLHIPESVANIGGNILGGGISAYICSDTEDCYAKTYADENGIEFILCDGLHLTVSEDTETGIAISYPENAYEGTPVFSIEKSIDEEGFAIINGLNNIKNFAIYDITSSVNGELAQPNAAVTVKIPLPEGYDPENVAVYHLNTVTGEAENMNARCENGYLIFETTHFSLFAVAQTVAEVKFEAKGTTAIKTQGGVNYIYGLQTKLTKAKFERDYINCENVTLTYNLSSSRYLGTGSVVTVTSTATGEVLGEYVVVIYGDVNGDAVADSLDASEILSVSSGAIASFEGAQKLAANLVGSRQTVDYSDYEALVSVISGVSTIDQVTGKAG